MTYSEDIEAWNSLGQPRYVQSLWRGLIEVPPAKLTVKDIQRVVGAYYSISQLDLLSDRRMRRLARPRQVAMWLCRKLTDRSLPDIGRRFGNRDHTTVIHAVRQIEKLRVDDHFVRRDCAILLEKLGGEPE